MLISIVAFEWRYHTRQVSFAAAAALFFVFGFALTATGFGPSNVHVDSPYSIAQSIGMLSLASVFILAVFCANAVVRDRETRMEELVFTTPVGKLPFLAGRFTGSFLAAFTAFSACVPGMIAARFAAPQDADRVGAFHIIHYLWPLLAIALPNLLFAAVVLFALSTLTRNVLASYAGSVLIYVLYFIAAALTNSPLMASSVPGVSDGPSPAALLDPFALSAFFEQTQHWSPAMRNTRLIALSGDFLLNRLLWIAVAAAMLGAVYRLFSFRVMTPSRKPARVIHEAAHVAAPYTAVEPHPSQWRAYVAATRMELRTFLLTLPFLAMTLLWAALAAFELINDVNGGEYGSASYPAPGMLFDTIQPPLTMLAMILLIYTSAEIVWRERSLRVTGILNATPVSNAVFVASKCTALAALIAALTATGLFAAALLQLAKGWTPDAGLLLSFAWFLAAPLVLFAITAVAIQTLSPHKYLGMLLVLLLGVVGMRGEFLGIDSRLLQFGWTPRLVYSDMNGFGGTAPFQWFLVYWAAFAGLFLLLATARWRHVAERMPHGRVVAVALAVLFIGSGAFLFYNTNVLHAHETDAEVLDWQADYEKTYRALAGLPQPVIREVRADVDVDPGQRRYRVRGQYVLVNETSKPIGTIVVAVRREAEAAAVTLPDARASYDARFHQTIFRLNAPLQPAARATLHYDLTYADRGFDVDSAAPAILANGSYITTQRAFPTIGYRAGYEIDDARERRRRGLPVSTAAAASQEREIPIADWVRFDVTVSTANDQRVVAPGSLVREWTHDGRRSFRFVTAAPIPNQFIIATARYAVTRETRHGVTIEIYHHPGHAYNVARMMRAAADTLDYCSANFGAYPHDTLRLAEVPAQFRNFSGFAQPGVVFLGENRGFLIDARDPQRLDLVYRRVAHEVAHQWWGYTLVPADAPGASLLTETLTKYTELMLLRKAYGREAVRQSLTYELDLYLSGRTGERGAEPPLARVENQSYLYYRKGAIVMHALSDLLGEAAVNAALRNLLHEQGGPGHRATSADLLRHLHAAATPAQQALIDRWMNDVVLYDFRMESARSRRLADGRYLVTMQVSAANRLAEMIDIGIYSADDTPLHVAKHALHEGMQEIAVIVDREPLIAAVDPYICRIDRNRMDNGRRVDH
jgi:ABC-2 type transport system permease protein